MFVVAGLKHGKVTAKNLSTDDSICWEKEPEVCVCMPREFRISCFGRKHGYRGLCFLG